MNGHVSVGGQGQCGQDAFEIQLPVARSGAVAVAQEVIQSVTVQLTADQVFDQR